MDKVSGQSSSIANKGMKFLKNYLIVVTVCIALLILTPIPAWGYTVRTKSGVYISSVKPSFNYKVAIQKNTKWCWAASVQMLLNYHNIEVNQQQVVERVFGTSINVAGYSEHINKGLSWSFRDRSGIVRIVRGSTVDITSMIPYLDRSSPVIAVLRQRGTRIAHAVVVASVRYRRGRERLGRIQYIIDRVTFYDPWPRRGTTTINGRDFINTFIHGHVLYLSRQ